LYVFFSIHIYNLAFELQTCMCMLLLEWSCKFMKRWWLWVVLLGFKNYFLFLPCSFLFHVKARFGFLFLPFLFLSHVNISSLEWVCAYAVVGVGGGFREFECMVHQLLVSLKGCYYGMCYLCRVRGLRLRKTQKFHFHRDIHG